MPRHIPRIYCPDLNNNGFAVPDYQQNHMINVLRMREGDQFLAFNENNGEWLSKIKEITKSAIICEALCQTRKYEPSRRLALGICQIKPENMKFAIEKCTELGATDFYFLTSSYTNYHSNIPKLQRIAVLAAEQSERLDVPQIHEEISLNEFLKNLPHEFTWFSAIERNETKSLRRIESFREGAGFIVGPEGGFSEAEKLLLSNHTIPIRLSNNILRTETACIACTYLTLICSDAVTKCHFACK